MYSDKDAQFSTGVFTVKSASSSESSVQTTVDTPIIVIAMLKVFEKMPKFGDFTTASLAI